MAENKQKRQYFETVGLKSNISSNIESKQKQMKRQEESDKVIKPIK